MVESFIAYKSWIQSIEHLSPEDQDKCLADIMRYGVGMEPRHTEEPQVVLCLNLIKGQIDASRDRYEARKMLGENLGRKKSFSDMAVYNLAREGKTSAQIANELGCSKSTIDHSLGWKMRKQEKVDFR